MRKHHHDDMAKFGKGNCQNQVTKHQKNNSTNIVSSSRIEYEPEKKQRIAYETYF